MGAHIPRTRKGDGSLPILPLKRAERPGEEATTDKLRKPLAAVTRPHEIYCECKQ